MRGVVVQQPETIVKNEYVDSCAPVQRPRDFCKLTCIDFIPSQMDKLELKNLAKI